MKVLILALGFMAIFEGLMPLIAPKVWQETLRKISSLPPGQVQRFSCVVVLCGLAAVWAVMLFD